METTYPNSHEEIIMEKNALLRIESYPSMLLLPSIINLYEKRLKSCIYEGLNTQVWMLNSRSFTMISSHVRIKNQNHNKRSWRTRTT